MDYRYTARQPASYTQTLSFAVLTLTWRIIVEIQTVKVRYWRLLFEYDAHDRLHYKMRLAA